MSVLRVRLVALGSVFILAFFFYLHSLYPLAGRAWKLSYGPASARLDPANSTLGFGALLAVSRNGSPRRADLLYAANLTGLDITIPDQPVWSEADEAAFRTPRESRISHGSMLAWMGHLNALTWFLSTDLETALILEDDVDWDITLRLKQVPLVSKALNELLNTSSRQASSSPQVSPNPHYWSDLDKWEILYLGHCGDFFKPEDFGRFEHNIYDDPTSMPQSRLFPKTAEFLQSLGIQDGQRMVHHSHWPLCTFGYAVTRASARRILDTYSDEGPGGCQAYDVRILEACRDNEWKCYTANPELFHHIQAPSEITNVNEGVDDQGRVLAPEGTTVNIGCGARSPNLKTDNPDTFNWLKDIVGEKGLCLADTAPTGRYDQRR